MREAPHVSGRRRAREETRAEQGRERGGVKVYVGREGPGRASLRRRPGGRIEGGASEPLHRTPAPLEGNIPAAAQSRAGTGVCGVPGKDIGPTQPYELLCQLWLSF